MAKQPFQEDYGSNGPANYERYFVPVIGRPLAEDLVRRAKLLAGDRVVDLACGTGIVTRLVLDEMRNGGHVTGVDVSPAMLDVARSVVPDEGRVRWIQADAGDLPLANESADVVLCGLGLEFVKDRSAALREIHRVLAPGGRVLLTLPGPAGAVFDALSRTMRQVVGPKAAGFVDVVFSLHQPEEVRTLLLGAGFTDPVIDAEERTLRLPEPATFLWEYVSSTPLAGIMRDVDQETRAALEARVREAWQPFVTDGRLTDRQRILTALARR